MFISYRTRVGYDAGLYSSWSDAVFVHTWLTNERPVVVGRIYSLNQSWLDPLGYGLTLVILKRDQATVTLMLCRSAKASRACRPVNWPLGCCR
jgi:hypothetical protein